MFCMRYAFESEAKVRRMMFQNITGALKKGGKLIGCVPSSSVIRKEVRESHASLEEGGVNEHQSPAASGNNI